MAPRLGYSELGQGPEPLPDGMRLFQAWGQLYTQSSKSIFGGTDHLPQAPTEALHSNICVVEQVPSCFHCRRGHDRSKLWGQRAEGGAGHPSLCLSHLPCNLLISGPQPWKQGLSSSSSSWGQLASWLHSGVQRCLSLGYACLQGTLMSAYRRRSNSTYD